MINYYTIISRAQPVRAAAIKFRQARPLHLHPSAIAAASTSALFLIKSALDSGIDAAP